MLKTEKKKKTVLKGRPRARLWKQRPNIRIRVNPHRVTRSAIRLLASGRGSLSRVLGNAKKRTRLFAPGLRWEQVILATHRGRAVGFAAFKCKGRGGPYAPRLRDFLSAHGIGGGVWRYIGFWLAESRDLCTPFYLYGIKVDPRYRGLHIARRLLDAASAEARLRGASHIELEVLDRHHQAERVYARYGYTVHRRRHFGWLSRFLGFASITVMRLPLE